MNETISSLKNYIFVALDTSDLQKAVRLATVLKDHVFGFKLGLEFYLANGATGVKEIAKIGLPIFLDLKLHDIPNTVSRAIKVLNKIENIFMLTIHTSGGRAMCEAAAKALEECYPDVKKRPILLGVTTLTSLNDEDLAIQCVGNVLEYVERMGVMAVECGVKGLVCSGLEVSVLRNRLGKEVVLVVPGIRVNSDFDDQKRIVNMKDAVSAGATYVVIGRSITEAHDPVAAVRSILSMQE